MIFERGRINNLGEFFLSGFTFFISSEFCVYTIRRAVESEGKSGRRLEWWQLSQRILFLLMFILCKERLFSKVPVDVKLVPWGNVQASGMQENCHEADGLLDCCWDVSVVMTSYTLHRAKDELQQFHLSCFHTLKIILHMHKTYVKAKWEMFLIDCRCCGSGCRFFYHATVNLVGWSKPPPPQWKCSLAATVAGGENFKFPPLGASGLHSKSMRSMRWTLQTLQTIQIAPR